MRANLFGVRLCFFKVMKSRYYKIGEVARELELEPYVLRFWEKEFPQLTPERSSKGQRLYTEEHLKLLKRIKYLLYEEKLTIEGAKLRLQEHNRWLEKVEDIRKELKDILKLLD